MILYIKLKFNNYNNIYQLSCYFKRYKLHLAGAVLFVLLEGFGKTHINKEVPNSLIKEAFDYYDTF